MSGAMRSGVQGGSKVSCTSAFSTPSTPRIASRALSTICPATGHMGDVSEIVACTSLPSTSMS